MNVATLLRRAASIALVAAPVACTSVDYAPVPARTGPTGIFFTAESLHVPYQSMGVIQLTRKGVLVFGFVDPVGTDLEAAMKELEPQIRAAGADGLANLRVQLTPFTTADRILGAIIFFVPRPSEVTISGELVKLRDTTQAPPVAPAAPGVVQ
jgi:hypothetical protein